jgi:hypothetical protein
MLAAAAATARRRVCGDWTPCSPPTPLPPLGCGGERRRRLDSLAGFHGTAGSAAPLRLRRCCSAAAECRGTNWPYRAGDFKQFQFQENRAKEVKSLKARSLTTLRLFDIRARYCSYRDLLLPRSRPCSSKGIEIFETAARRQACQPGPAVIPP